MKVSIICVYNNEQALNTQLKESLRIQNIEYELVEVDNRSRRFNTAAEALNYGAQMSKGDVLLFVHQDVFFKDSDGVKKLVDFIERCKLGSIVGVAGAVAKSKENIGNYTTGSIYNEKMINKFREIVSVDCIDEVAFGMTKSTFALHEFDCNLCDNWHLYAVEMCLFQKKKGGKVYVYPIEIHHFSKGRINLLYMKNFLKIADFYRDDFKYIWTTCYKMKNTFIYTRFIFFCWIVNRVIRRKDLY